jgi:hypothetical protein
MVVFAAGAEHTTSVGSEMAIRKKRLFKLAGHRVIALSKDAKTRLMRVDFAQPIFGD